MGVLPARLVVRADGGDEYDARTWIVILFQDYGVMPPAKFTADIEAEINENDFPLLVCF